MRRCGAHRPLLRPKGISMNFKAWVLLVSAMRPHACPARRCRQARRRSTSTCRVWAPSQAPSSRPPTNMLSARRSCGRFEPTPPTCRTPKRANTSTSSATSSSATRTPTPTSSSSFPSGTQRSTPSRFRAATSPCTRAPSSTPRTKANSQASWATKSATSPSATSRA